MTKTTAVLYARFSSDLQKDRSIDDQFAVCQSLATRDGLEVVRRYSDRAKSGSSMFERDGLIEMMAAAKRKEFAVVVVENLDRLSRDQEDLPGLFKRLTYYEVEIRTVNEGTTTAMHVGIRSLVGSMFLTDLAAKVRRGQAGLAREGKISSGVTYGYRKVLGKPGEREIDPEKAEVVRRIFREYADGKSPRDIAGGLAKDGIPNPSGAKLWNHQVFVGGYFRHGMLANKMYIGVLEWNTSRTVHNPETGKRMKRAGLPDDLIVTPVPHLRIIDQDLWDAVAKVKQGRAKHKFGASGKSRATFLPRGTHLLSGILRCECGSHMRIAVRPRGQACRWACAAAQQNGSCSHTRTYDADHLQAVIFGGMRRHLTDPAAIARAVKGYGAERTELEKKHRDDAVATRKRLNRIQVELDRIVTAIQKSDVPIEILVAKLNPLEAERVGLTERLRLIEAENVVTLHPGVIEAYCRDVEELYLGLTAGGEIAPKYRTAFRNLIDSIVVHPTRKRMPYEVTPYGRLSALLGVSLFPSGARTAEQIVDEEGAYFASGTPGTTGLPTSKYKIVSLGRWRQGHVVPAAEPHPARRARHG